jgi:multisubunit Na+/H+ antiporter MnhF subunit
MIAPSPFLQAVSLFCLATLLVSGAMTLYRLGIGPDTPDRAVAFDTLTMVFVGVVCTLCVYWSSSLYFDAVWILTLVGYLGSAAIARYLERGRLF